MLYKIISKILNARLQEVLLEIISYNQNTFVKNRVISENILLVHKILYSFKHPKTKYDHKLALKLDISKAYDRIEWLFLQTIMHKWGFSEIFINCVIQCTVTSCHLFGIKLHRNGPIISHLLFSDDSIIFSKADIQSVMRIQHLLHRYALASGQMINLDKCGLQSQSHKYIGMRILIGASKSATFNHIVHKIQHKLNGWKEKFLSMRYFLFLYACNKINKMVAAYWWGSPELVTKSTNFFGFVAQNPAFNAFSMESTSASLAGTSTQN
ncbi:uncharacterized protein LOC126669915 [Mercurialis annua]|uniref:uncharacterized protein LOC126669915 n=1 Tax=Mercurialis annua TaxID=3986 RepID=UPI00215FE7E3|nr:uncharacterized protein LOC126669915 [Mercurialis annua]